MIFEFTQASGQRKNYGIVIERVGNGVMVLLDRFRPNDKSELPVRYRYVNLDGNPYVIPGASRRLLPLGTPVTWQDKNLRHLASTACSGDWQMGGAQAFVEQFADRLNDEQVSWLGSRAASR